MAWAQHALGEMTAPKKEPAWPSRFPGRYLDYRFAGLCDDERLSPSRAIEQP
jgi:hypothetical protein